MNISTNIRTVFIITAILLPTLTFGASMFDFFKICVFSDINGIVTKNSTPVSGAVVKRQAKLVFNDKLFTDETTTDEDGKFKFDAIYTNSINKYLPSAALVEQDIFIQVNDESYHAWDVVKQNYDLYGEFNQNVSELNDSEIIRLNLNCELTNERKARVAPNHEHTSIIGICRWENE